MKNKDTKIVANNVTLVPSLQFMEKLRKYILFFFFFFDTDFFFFFIRDRF